MNSFSLKNCFPLLLLLLLSACNPDGPTIQQTKLPNGKVLNVQGVTVLLLGEGQTGLMLQYITDIPAEDKDARREEAKEIWTFFREDVEKDGHIMGVLAPTQPSKPERITNQFGYMFNWKIDEQGEWFLAN